MSILEDYETKLNKSGDEIIHLVSAYNVGRGLRIALCGYDCSGRSPKPDNTATCVVCLDISKNRKQ